MGVWKPFWEKVQCQICSCVCRKPKTKFKMNEHCIKSPLCSGPFPLLCRRFVFLLCAMLCVCHSRAEHSLPLSSHFAFDLSDVASVRIFDASNSADFSNIRNSCHPMTDLTSWDDTDERLTESKAWFSQAMMKDRTSSDKRDPRVNAVMHRTSWEQNFLIFSDFSLLSASCGFFTPALALTKMERKSSLRSGNNMFFDQKPSKSKNADLWESATALLAEDTKSKYASTE